MITYEQIKKITEGYSRYNQDACFTLSQQLTFDEWAEGPGKELMYSVVSTSTADQLDQIHHKELVRQLAEEMAEAHYNSNVGRYVIMPPGQPTSFSELSQTGKEMCITVMTPVAESIVVKFGTKMFEEGFEMGKQVALAHMSGHHPKSYEERKKELMTERGLIAEKEGKDETK